MNRRQFLRDSALASASVALMGATPFAAHAESPSTDARIEVLIDEPLGTISPNIYGHFAENLSGVLYDGIWVGTGSKVPNVDGLRKELIDQMRKIKAPVVRYPGGVLCRQLQLGRRHWSCRAASAPHEFLGGRDFREIACQPSL